MVGSLSRSRKYKTPDAMLYLYKSQIRPRMEYCCYIRTGAILTVQLQQSSKALTLHDGYLVILHPATLISQTKHHQPFIYIAIAMANVRTSSIP